MLKTIAVTGSIASGKSTVCSFFKEWGAAIFDADTTVHHAATHNHTIHQALIELLGEEIFKGNTIQRNRILEILMKKPHLLTSLEQIYHPYVLTTMHHEIQKAKKASFAYFVAEIPLLFESHYFRHQTFERTIAVISDPKIAISRYLERGGTIDQFSFLEKWQLPIDQKSKLADHTLINNGTVEELYRASYQLFLDLCRDHKNEN